MARPKKEYSQSQRLLGIYDALCRGLAVRAASLAEKYEVSRRTCERDLAVLKKVLDGRLVEEQRLDYTYYRLPRDVTPGAVSREQVLAYVCGAKMISFLSGPEFRLDAAGLGELLWSALEQKHKIPSARFAERVLVTQTGHKMYAEQPETQEVLHAMVDALLYERGLRVSYLSPARASAGKKPVVLDVYPLGMVFHRGGVYFVVEVRDRWWRGERRILLALDRMQIEEYTAAGWSEYPDDFDLETFLGDAFGIFGGDGSVEVTLRFDADYADYVRERTWHPEQQLETEEGGALVLKFPVSGFGEVSDWILGMGSKVEVIGPAELREHVVERLRNALGRYA